MAGRGAESGQKVHPSASGGLEGSSGRVVQGSFSVAGAQKAQGGFTVYRVKFKVSSQDSEGKQLLQEREALKRFSDFQSLWKQLETVHAQAKAKTKLPSLIKAKYFERFKESVIEERKKSIEEMLHFVSNSPHLANSSPMLAFLTGSKLSQTLPDTNSSVRPTSLPTTTTVTVTPPSSRRAGRVAPLHSEEDDEEGLAVGGSLVAVRGSPVIKQAPCGLENDLEPHVGEQNLPTSLDANNIKAKGRLKNSEGATAAVVGEVENRQKRMSESSSSSSEEIDSNIDAAAKNFGREETHGNDNGNEQAEGMKEGVPTSSLPAESSRVAGAGGQSEMTWWADAMAECDNITDDLDEVVSKIEQGGATGGGGASSKGSAGRKSSRRGSKTSENKGSRPSSQSPSPRQRKPSPSAQRDAAYVVSAGRLIGQALASEREGEHDEAFDLLKAGVDVLLNGVQTDKDKARREMVRRKTSEYLLYAENLQQRKNQQPPKSENTASVPAAKPHHLQDFKVKQILGKVMVVESRHTGQSYVFKVLHKSLRKMAALPKGQAKTSRNKSSRQCPYMVKLFHHYETPNHRIFLLLEHMPRGTLLDFVSTKRTQWLRLREAATNPPPSSSLVSVTQGERRGQEGVAGSGGGDVESAIDEIEPDIKDDSFEILSDGDDEAEDNEEDPDMEKMLSELTDIVPPSSAPIAPADWSLSSSGVQGGGEKEEGVDLSGESEDEEEDPLVIMRKRLEAYIMKDDPSEIDDNQILNNELSDNLKNEDRTTEKEDRDEKDKIQLGELRLQDVDETEKDSKDGHDTNLKDEDSKDDDSSSSDSELSDAAINILPPTPTINRDMFGGVSLPSQAQSSTDSLTVGKKSATPTDANRTPTLPMAMRRGKSKSATPPSELGEEEGEATDQGGGPFFSPASSRNSPDVKKVDDWSQRLEASVKQWAAQIVLALEHLHAHKIVCKDLHPANILLNESGGAVLSYFGRWEFVEAKKFNMELARSLYVAPELQRLGRVTAAADWWSLGAFLFEILTGHTLASCHPGGVHSHLPLRIPTPLSSEAQSLLQQLLQVSPSERLGSGATGIEELKSHSFFAGVDWVNP